MSDTNNHPWSHDPARDAAARREEDEAQWRRLDVGEVIEDGDEFLSAMDGKWRRTAAIGTPVVGSITYRRRRAPPLLHRDLPDALAALTRRVEGLETLAEAWRQQCEREADGVSVTPQREAEPDSRRAIVHIDTDDTIDERVWDERGNEDGAMADAVSGTAGDPGTPVENRASPGGGAAERSGGRGAAVNSDGLRTERVTLQVTHVDRRHVSALDWPYMVANYFHHFGESVRVVEEAAEITRLTAERDAAIRERDAARAECERLRTGELFRQLCGDRFAQAVTEAEAAIRERDEAKARVAELEAAAANAGGEPQPPRGWLHLSDADCAALYLARAVLDGVFVGTWQEKFDASKRLVDIRDRAIREAGVEVVE